MPITRKQFEIGIDPKIEEWMEKIRAFLSEHKDEAFNANELLEALHGRNEPKDFLAAVEKLVELGAAEKKIIRGTDYYSYREQPKGKNGGIVVVGW